MFRPKHTIRSVAAELADGLDSGGVILRPEDREDDHGDASGIESRIRTTLSRHESRFGRYRIVAGLLIVVVSASALFLGISHAISNDVISQFLTRSASVVMVLCLVAYVLLTSLGLRSRDKVIELRTYLRLLEGSDPRTAKQLLRRAAPELREHEPAA
jgi:hypothetical protein